MSGYDYFKKRANAVYTKMSEAGKELHCKVDKVMRTGYSPELYLSLVLNKNQENYYQNLIGVLSWDVGLECIDIHVDVALFYTFLSQTLKGNLDQSLNMVFPP